MKTLSHNGLNIVIACNRLDDRCNIQKMILENNFNHKITCVYTNAQLMDYLLKKGSYSGCPEPMPDCVLLNVDSNSDEILSTVTQLRYFEELRSIPVYICGKNLLPAEKQKAITAGALNVFDLTNGYEQLNTMISLSIRKAAA